MTMLLSGGHQDSDKGGMPMPNRAREVTCTHCHRTNYWKGAPRPADMLHCRYCETAIMTHEEHLRLEAARILAKFIKTDSEEEVARLKASLSSRQAR